MHINILHCIAHKLDTKDLLSLCQVHRELRHDRSFWKKVIRKRHARVIDDEGDLLHLFLELEEFVHGSVKLVVNFVFDGVMNVQQSYMQVHSIFTKVMGEFDVEHGLDVLSGKYVRKDRDGYSLTYHIYPKTRLTRIEAMSMIMLLLHRVKLPKNFSNVRMLC
ncbi:F-box domain-containing protein [Brazilian cedratvirus IHUMI]|uniref:F-box domain-containing protein n=1 Tax=Brazilian cedratvirus IHUMI TaxID=2126980 RepID=A0A2R8FEY3_9VIRU|nr:F-box domain-containing protein [Brazilian cedratvirus IHUMI]